MAEVSIDFAVEGTLDAFDLPSSPDIALELLCAGCTTTDAPAEVHCLVRVGADVPPLAGEVSFFHGGVRVRRTSAGWMFWDLQCSVEVDLQSRVVTARIPPGKHHLGGFFRTTVFVALVLQLRELGRFHVHAGLVQRRDAALLIVGPSGSGKSTTTLSLARAGFEALADDAVFLSSAGASPVARPFHVTPTTMTAFPSLVATSQTDIGKYEVSVASTRAHPVQPTGIVFLSGPAPSTRIARVEPADALGMLIESSALVVVDGAAQITEHLALLSALVEQTPSVLLAAGPDWLTQANDTALLDTLHQRD